MDLTSVFSSSSNFPTTSISIENELETTTLDAILEEEDLGARPYIVFVLLTITSLCSVIGNGLVVVSIWKEASLHSPSNHFIASLAMADLLVGGVVIPFEALTELLGQRWLFGVLWCDLWRAFDVLLATSSILNLCVISLDRFWAISEPFSYPSKMTPLMSARLIFGVWACSVGISLPAILYWRWTRTSPFPPETCLFTQDALYLLASSMISFYLPLVVMLYTYFRIYRAAVRQTRSIEMGAKFYYDKELELKLRMRIHRGGSNRNRGERFSLPTATPPNGRPMEMRPLTVVGSLGPAGEAKLVTASTSECPDSPVTFMKNRGSMVRRKLSRFSKEKKAAKTLAIVLGVFIICWMPFFVLNVISGLCPKCGLQNSLLFSLFTWLGWVNSLMNPLIYTIKSPDFRKAFARMLCCNRYRRVEMAATRAWSYVKR
ncbi:Dopamine receptor 2 [Folsomia candida]|uniref:Dopamine receptor 2 n=1 Tax=Folsomia candida TaxID=158441 RepID=A0A226EX31_FOLCA|nr:Dopamine receptor 2 [Folsomia candida]